MQSGVDDTKKKTGSSNNFLEIVSIYHIFYTAIRNNFHPFFLIHREKKSETLINQFKNEATQLNIQFLKCGGKQQVHGFEVIWS